MSAGTRRVLVTRAAAQADGLCAPLRAAGMVPVAIPVMRLRSILDPSERERLRTRIQAGDFDDVVFTSANGVQVLLHDAVVCAPGARVFSIGPGTTAALEARGWSPEDLPEGFIAESLARLITKRGIGGHRVLLPRARGARDVLPQLLRAAGAEVEVAELYCMEPDWSSAEPLRQALVTGALDCVTFTSGSAVRSFAELTGGLRPPAPCLLACIGPVTAAELARVGMAAQVVAATHSMAGLAAAVVAALAALPENGVLS